MQGKQTGPPHEKKKNVDKLKYPPPPKKNKTK